MAGIMALPHTLNAQNNEHLVIFIQDGRSISQDFKRRALPQIKRIARQNGLPVEVVEASKGAPQEVTFTPAIFYHKGHVNIPFNGRYADFASLSSFVKSGGIAQPATITPSTAGTDAVAWNIGRATIMTTIRIHPLTGVPPKMKKFDQQQFETQAMNALKQGMEYLQPIAPDWRLPAKRYRMDFYPEVNKREGVLLIQMELYSEFDPHTPVFKTEIPSGSDWQVWQTAFEKAGNRLEKALIAQISNWDNGDGFDTLKAPVESWSNAMKRNFEKNRTLKEKGVVSLSGER